jgi:hypothetical protein
MKKADPLPEIPDKAPDCRRCKHYKVTWEPSFPHACTLFGVKCRNHLPSMEVFLSAGKHCFSFQQKELTKNDN